MATVETQKLQEIAGRIRELRRIEGLLMTSALTVLNRELVARVIFPPQMRMPGDRSVASA